ncbi:MAG: hypothetical protein Ct9H300mP19_01540 [Dehalococcoidia bacterium]|nr:MAG: hypothetical protein Ct9H300mP19_01540 [Dehalococcoidia bacterium]
MEGLRRITDDLGIVLIFDEVIAFRIAYGGAQDYYGVKPDLTCLGKVVGGGMPVGAFGAVMTSCHYGTPLTEDLLSSTPEHSTEPPDGSGWGATLESLTPDKYEYLERLGDMLRSN